MKAREAVNKTDRYTIEDYLYGCLNFEIPESILPPIFYKRGVDARSTCDELGLQIVELLEADLYTKIATTTPDKLNSTTDSDNGWEHSGGGFSITDEYRNLLFAAANKIYAKYGEPLVGKNNRFKISSHGIQRARISMDGEPLPHKV